MNEEGKSFAFSLGLCFSFLLVIFVICPFFQNEGDLVEFPEHFYWFFMCLCVMVFISTIGSFISYVFSYAVCFVNRCYFFIKYREPIRIYTGDSVQ